jgi:hypothetical protein
MNRRILLSIVLLFFLTLPGTSWAQFAQRGGIEGTVFDPSGAVVPGVNITLLDLAQNQNRKIQSDAAGRFEFDNLPAGQYQLTASLQGFETAKSEAITVNIGAISDYRFNLRTGSVEQSVQVTDQPAGLATDQVSIDTNVSEKEVQDLPLNGRNFTALAALAPGVATTPQPNINPGGTYAVGAQFAMGGTFYTAGGSFQGSRDNGFYLNGVNISDDWDSSISYAPSVEALTTGTLAVTDFSAANGHDLSTLSMQTKGGSSKFHGEAFEFLENDDLNALNPLDKAYSENLLGTLAVKPTLRRNQFGGNLGGPIYIPKLLPSLKRKVFFFANYENFIESDGSEPQYTSVPSAAERSGDFSELLTGPSPIQLYNPFYTTYDASGYSSRPAIPGNRLDQATRPDGSSLVDSNSGGILNLWPSPNISDTPSYEPNYYAPLFLGFSDYHIDTRFDATLTSKDSVFFTWSRSIGANDNSGGITPPQLYVVNNQDTSSLVTLNYAHVFAPRLTNEFIFGWGHAVLTGQTPGEISWLNGASNPLNSLFQNTGTGITQGVLAVNVYNYANPGFDELGGIGSKSLQFSDNLDWTVGRHSMAAGFNYLWKASGGGYDISRFVTFGEGSYWDGFPREEFSSGGYDQNYDGGDGMADLVMGLPQDLHQPYLFSGYTPPAPEPWNIFPYWGLYVNDKFHLTPKLMISGGLRYDLSIPFFNNLNLCCAVYSPTSDGGVLKLSGFAEGVPQHYLSAQKHDFAPRVSFAYSPTSKWTVRGGYGIFFNTGSTQMSAMQNDLLGSPSGYETGNDQTNVTVGAQSDTPVLGLSQILQTQSTLPLGQFPVSTGPGQGYFGDGQLTTVAYDDEGSTPLPYYQRYIVDLQREITPRDMVTVSYNGVQGRKGTNEVNINLPPYATGWSTDNDFNAARPNNVGRFGDIYVLRPNLNSHFNAGIVQYRHDLTNGLQVIANYTYGKTVSDYPWANTISENGEWGGASGFQYSNLFNRGETTFSHRHRFVYSWIWSPQYGRAWPIWAKTPLAGWRISGIGTLESGDMFTIVNNETTAADYAGNDELFVSGNPNLSRGQKTFLRQFDTSKFTVPPNGVRGNSGLGTIRGPGQDNVDLSLAKTFPLFETLHLEFRADAFNAVNHTQWNAIQTTYPYGDYPYGNAANYGNIPFGQVAGAREARIGQLGLKMVF